MKRIPLIVFCLLAAMQLAAQRYSFYNLSVENGLIQSQVRSLAQDKYGHLWIGTLGGLSRFDGTQFTNYNVRNGLLDNSVQAITTDNNGNLWIGTQEGLSMYNGKEFQHFRLEVYEGSDGPTIRKIHVTQDNKIWCHTNESVYYIQDNMVKKLPLPDSNISISSLSSTGDTTWIGTRGKIYRHYNNTWDSLFYYIPDYEKPPVFTTGFLHTPSGKTYFSTGTGLFHLENDTVKVVRTKQGSLYNILFTGITQSADGAVWLRSQRGAYRLKDSMLVQYDKDNGFTDNAVTAILADKEGSIWFGTEGHGIYRFSGAQFSILDEKSNLPSELVMSFAPTPKGNLYIGTADAGLYYLDDNKVIPVALKNNKAFISALLASNEYDIWIGTQREGLWRLKGGERIYYNTPQMPGNAFIFSLYKDTVGTIWIGTSNGAVQYHNNRFYSLTGINDNIVAFAPIGRDSMLLASNAGLFLYHDSTITKYITRAAPDSAHLQCMLYKNGKLWLGTADNGIIYYDIYTRKAQVLNKDNGLRSDFVYNITADDIGNIWVGTGFGIHKIHLENNKPQVTFYGKEQGIIGMESNQNAACKMPDGTLWFGTTKGAVHIDPEKKLVLPQPISIVLQSVKVFGDDIRDTTYYDSTDNWYNVPYQLTLPPKKNNVTFTFKGITLNGSEQLLYRYRIQGLEAPWSDWAPLNSVTYSALPPGDYTLLIESKTFNSDEVRSLSYPFTIITPLHKTKWFSIMILGVCILSGVSIQYLLNKRKQNRQALVEKLRREEQSKVRQRTAEDFHDEVGNRLTRINVLTNVLNAKMGNISPENQRIINQIQDNTAQLYSGTRDILWSLSASNDDLYEILHRIRDFGNDLFADTDISFTFTGSDQRWHHYRLPLDMSRNLQMIFKEALNNCLKYANATAVKLDISLKQNDILHIMLVDNGKGFNIEEVVKGNGLNNMRNRTERLKGKLYIDSIPGKGTTINLHFRLPHKNK